MLFKILHGDVSRISTDITPFHEGYCYVTHDGYMYIDMNIGTIESPNYQRIKLNAKDAETLGMHSADEFLLATDIDTILAQAKESGEFDGEDGVSVTHIWNGTNLTVTSASGTSSANLKGDKGDQGQKGDKGNDGYSPVRGTDYWTESDKAEIKSYVDEAILGGEW